MNPCKLCDYPMHDKTGSHYMIHFIIHHAHLLEHIDAYKLLEEIIKENFIKDDTSS